MTITAIELHFRDVPVFIIASHVVAVSPQTSSPGCLVYMAGGHTCLVSEDYQRVQSMLKRALVKMVEGE